ncbi:MAG: methylase [Candidatus Lambdaproteobacteria bacterium RIFOXYD1_FULL_56_27]|uniref:site-specific DNA-methyltransferase (adenine-specific) n=1 Tax=Candidatus Lambdaproteobacteria bacterium RIFOXYD2_FULL_56_26 TaxID=1817773 RepID=A0A1F6GL74_9PROT|nr:MAG: methylase [Candidatus Lambdaproteobacteria bacterium RIFOXYD2_FULL_56_26]OGH03589.1 MAG: methylase [Candidatus Lambdaproteobacteria bacterium RIFOXYC1_FULL_56_13]OGH08726.1 MAG: methylase [Candidatus Lambdaproteobacteria bacterium RIFOXYD1_FULL_56_27]
MPLSWNEIRNRAVVFCKEWSNATEERAESQSFWNAFFEVFGVSRRRVAGFESRVKTLDGTSGFVDLLWKGTLLIEQKSRGKDLDRAHTQAKDYFEGLPDSALPRYILVSDFERFRLYDLENNDQICADFTLKDLPKFTKVFAFIAGYKTTEVKAEDPVNLKAAEKMAALHDQLKEVGYEGKALEVYLVRLLFCLFAEDTGIFEKNLFLDLLLSFTKEDGSDLAGTLAQLFDVLNTPRPKRFKNLADCYDDFEYINGKLFAEPLPLASFDRQMRESLIEASRLDWSRISPAIFGSLFQGVMEPKERRNLGAHYTAESNILKLIGPLFLDQLKAELATIRGNKKKLEAFQDKLASLTFLDPACGCGNFLVITYRELRLLELEVLKQLYSGQQVLKLDHLFKVNVDQFYGIEYEEFPAQIAQVALWLTDHQMNTLVGEHFGQYFARLPLTKSANILHDNALAVDWVTLVPKTKLSYILGNPPFVGAKYQTSSQRADMEKVFAGVKGAGTLDYVAAWYLKAAQYIRETGIEVAFVSTNSITQGEQVGILWAELMEKYLIKINFAHRTFSWTSEARGKAAVHCVIIGFARQNRTEKRLFEYETPTSPPLEVSAKQINPYLVDGANVVIKKRSSSICTAPKMSFGSMPNDGKGNLLLSSDEKVEFIHENPGAEPLIRRYINAQEYLNNQDRWCLWLLGKASQEFRKFPGIMSRLKRVQEERLKSDRKATRLLAEQPSLFGEIRQPTQNYIAIPKTSSESRKYIPISILDKTIVAGSEIFTICSDSLFNLGVLTSELHMDWMRYTAGRLESRYRYSVGIVYNNFPWPDQPDPKTVAAVEALAQAILVARAHFPNSTLADLYDPLTMPPELLKAHRALDKAVEKAYRANLNPELKKLSDSLETEMKRVGFLLELHQTYLGRLEAQTKPKGKGKKQPPTP